MRHVEAVGFGPGLRPYPSGGLPIRPKKSSRISGPKAYKGAPKLVPQNH